MRNFKPLLAWLPLVLILLFQLPEILRHYRLEGTRLNQEKYFDLQTSAPIFYPPKGSALTIYWASWCTPCLIEMNRLKSSVLAEKIPKRAIYAINPFEDLNTVKHYLKKNTYPFTFVSSPEISQRLQINKTPTILWTKDGIITSMNSGMSLIGIWKAELLLD